MTNSRLLDFSELLKDVDFSEELRVYTDVFLEEVIGDLQEQIDLIKAELEWRDSEAEKEELAIHTCDCGDEHEVEEEEE